ncbi:MAG: FtsX-like permease family protein [Rhodanobacter sp.]
MQWRLILHSLTRHRLTVLLLVVQVALTCAIVCNVVFMIASRSTQMRLPSGVAENQLVMIQSVDVGDNQHPLVRHDEDLAALRAITGVQSVAAVDALPFNENDWTSSINTSADSNQSGISVPASAYNGTPGELQTLGLHLLAGRDFLPDEYVPEDSAHGGLGLSRVPATIVTRALADKLFPGGNALGKSVYPWDAHPTRIVGIVDHLLRPHLHGAGANEDSMLFSMLPDDSSVTYVLRTAPQDRLRVLRDAKTVLTGLDHQRILRDAHTFVELRASFFHRDRTMIGMLIAAALALLAVTAVAIGGLASFWVQQRRKQIGIRRAIGATRGDILRYFQSENFLIVTLGIVIGMALAFVLNAMLMRFYELPHLPLYYLPIGALVLWGLGQLAVLGPALRASQVPPVVATRSV